MRTLDKLEYCNMLAKVEPGRFIITMTPWETAILIDKYFEYYDTPKE